MIMTLMTIGTNIMTNIRRGFRSVQRLPGEQSSPQQHQTSFRAGSGLVGGSDQQTGEKCGQQTDKKY